MLKTRSCPTSNSNSQSSMFRWELESWELGVDSAALGDRPLLQCPQPLFDDCRNLHVVLFEHQHVTVALDPDISESHETR